MIISLQAFFVNAKILFSAFHIIRPNLFWSSSFFFDHIILFNILFYLYIKVNSY